MVMALLRLAKHPLADFRGRKPIPWISSAVAVAKARFMAGPAAATQIMSRRGLRSRRKFTGTGLA